MNGSALFHEVQRPQYFAGFTLLILGAAVFMTVSLISQVFYNTPIGNDPTSDVALFFLWLLVGIGLPLFWLSIRLIVEVHDDRIHIRIPLLASREIDTSDIVTAMAETYRPIREYGGWGVRGTRNGTRVYNMRGNEGVMITLRNGRRVLIGSQRAKELQQIIHGFIHQ